MKDNIWKKEFTAGEYKLKNLSLANNMELSILNEEIIKYWKFNDKGNQSLDVELVKLNMKEGKITEMFERIEVLLDEILVDDALKESLEPYKVFMLIPDIWFAVKEYKESLKKK